MKSFLLSSFFLVLCISCNNSAEKSSSHDLPQQYNPLAEGHNSRNSVDWEGTYSGVLPCNDCRAVETYISLNANNTFEMTRIYLETEIDSFEEIKTNGTFTWNENGSAITLNGLKEEIPELKVGEMFLQPLDAYGFEIKAEPGNNFKLLKQ